MKTFLISDTHFGHANILTFKNTDGTPVRDFSSLEEMNETMVDNWNKVVSPIDKVYHLGDVLFTKKWLDLILPRLNGTKVLIKGNHDNLKLSQYQQYFKDVRAVWVLDKLVLSHIPIHPESLSRWKANVHGHLHGNSLDDPRYFNVSVEKVNYTPVDFEYIRSVYA
jgi:calcineurin-like phosphoesterase family protein